MKAGQTEVKTTDCQNQLTSFKGHESKSFQCLAFISCKVCQTSMGWADLTSAGKKELQVYDIANTITKIIKMLFQHTFKATVHEAKNYKHIELL